MKGETRCIRPRRPDITQQLKPLGNDGGVVAGQEMEAGTEEFKKKIKGLEEILMEHWEYNGDRDGDSVPTLKVPADPTEKERLEHEVTHTPPKPGCKYCMMGRGVRRSHFTNVLDPETAEGPSKLSIEYMYLNDDEGQKDQPQMVMVDHGEGRVFAYIVPKQGVLEQAEWVPNRMIRDIDNFGYKDVVIQIKSDQEPAIVAI